MTFQQTHDVYCKRFNNWETVQTGGPSFSTRTSLCKRERERVFWTGRPANAVSHKLCMRRRNVWWKLLSSRRGPLLFRPEYFISSCRPIYYFVHALSLVSSLSSFSGDLPFILHSCLQHSPPPARYSLISCYKIIFGRVDIPASELSFRLSSVVDNHRYKIFKHHCSCRPYTERSMFFHCKSPMYHVWNNLPYDVLDFCTIYCFSVHRRQDWLFGFLYCYSNSVLWH